MRILAAFGNERIYLMTALKMRRSPFTSTLNPPRTFDKFPSHIVTRIDNIADHIISPPVP
jgi:hypothetical protein